MNLQKLPKYLAKYAFREDLIATPPDHALGMVVVIPAHAGKGILLEIAGRHPLEHRPD